jgi:hypothetical protein
LSACIASHHLNGRAHAIIRSIKSSPPQTPKKKRLSLSRAACSAKKKTFPLLLHAYPLTDYPAFPFPFPLLHVLLSSDGEPGDWLFGWIVFGFCFCFAFSFSFRIGLQRTKVTIVRRRKHGNKTLDGLGIAGVAINYRKVLTHTRMGRRRMETID